MAYDQSITAYEGHTNQNRFLLLDFRSSPDVPSNDELCWYSSHMCQAMNYDDILVLQSSDAADARYRIFGADGREAQFCCNGALFALSVLAESNENCFILQVGTSLCSGVLEESQASLYIDEVRQIDAALSDLLREFLQNFHIDSLGLYSVYDEPHLVLDSRYATRDLNEYHCQILGQSFGLPGGVNVTQVKKNAHRNEFDTVTFERGAKRFTPSCGSGSISAIEAIGAAGLGTYSCYTVRSPGGEHRVLRSQRSFPYVLRARPDYRWLQSFHSVGDLLSSRLSHHHHSQAHMLRGEAR